MWRDRRSCTRLIPGDAAHLSLVRLRTGHQLKVLDIGVHGALVQGGARLLPGRVVDLHMTTSRGRLLVRALVVRSYVSSLDADAVTYESGLAFERPIALAPSEAA